MASSNVLLLVSLAACSTSTSDQSTIDGGQSDTSSVTPDAATSGPAVTGSGTLEVTLELTTTAAGEAHVDVFIRTLANAEVNDATVTFTKDGTDLTVPSYGSGVYMAGFSGEASTYALAITRGNDSVMVVGIEKVSIPIPVITPDPPAASTAATVTWPRPDTATSSSINVYRSGAGHVWPPSPQNDHDTGSLTIPATALSASGTYTFILYRERMTSPASNVTLRVAAATRFERTVN